MASPLQYFRKHQGYILAVLGVILIVTWVIGDALSNLFQPSPQDRQQQVNSGVVAQWKLGDITRGDLRTAGWEHEAVIRFLLEVIDRAQKDGAKPQAPFLSISQNGIDLGLAMRTDDPTLVQVMLFAQKGKEMGVVVDQAAMMDYLTNLGGFALTEADFHDLARETVSQHRDGEHGAPLVTVTQLFDRLKLELTSLQAQAMFSAGLTGFSTGELWEYHEQLHRRDKIEAFPIKVADYHDRFKESDAKEDELRKIYDKGKDRTPHPESPEPGFRQPQKLGFSYVKVDFEKYLAAAKKDVTKAQLVEEYEKEIAAGNFRNLKFDTGEATKTPSEGATPKTGTEESGNPREPAGDDAKAPAAEKKTEGDAKSGSDAQPGEKPAEKTKTSPAAEVKASEKTDKSCQEEPARETESKSQGDKPASDSAAKDDAAKDSEAKPDEKKEKPAESAPATGTTDDKSTEAKPAEPEFKPLSEVRDQLMNKLASPAARTANDAAIKDITRAVSDYGTKYTRWSEERKAGTKTGATDPGELKLNALAARHGLTVEKSPLADRFAVAKTDLGQQAAFRSVQGTVPFADGAFFENRPLYAPQEASSISGETSFVYWRTEEQPSVQVPFEKARPQVVRAWIHQQAVEVAKKEAQALADKALKAPSLKDVLTADQAKLIVQPLPFTWLSRGSTPLAFSEAGPSLSTVNGIPLAGSEFMKGVFGLKVGEAGVAIDQPQDTVYVVRVLAEEPAMDIRREMFLQGLQAGRFGDLISYAMMASRDVMGDAVEELREEYQLKWVETPEFGGM